AQPTYTAREYLAAVQQDRAQGVRDDAEDELSDTETVFSDDPSSEGSDESASLDDEDVFEFGHTDDEIEDEEDDGYVHYVQDDKNYDPTDPEFWRRYYHGDFKKFSLRMGPEREFHTSFKDVAWYDPKKPRRVADEEDLRETQRAWDDVALGRGPFESRQKLVEVHESLMRALNDLDDEVADQQGAVSKAVQRREPGVVLEEGWDIEKVVNELRMRSTIEVEHAPIDNLRRGVVYLARSLHLKEILMYRGKNAYPPTFVPPAVGEPEDVCAADEEEQEYVLV
ncbi:uncharacterized protein B0H18DRAFT_1002508, partial [Fomitopsis serialis]|uniref:uncharacterized protein n=1 Tax=Fomitopsis serialis TaxID=139415 RepID=UPI002007FE49